MSSNGQARRVVRAGRVAAVVAALLLVGATGAQASGATVTRNLSCGTAFIRTESASNGTATHMHWSASGDYMRDFKSTSYQVVDWHPKISRSGGWVIASSWLVSTRGFCS